MSSSDDEGLHEKELAKALALSKETFDWSLSKRRPISMSPLPQCGLPKASSALLSHPRGSNHMVKSKSFSSSLSKGTEEGNLIDFGRDFGGSGMSLEGNDVLEAFDPILRRGNSPPQTGLPAYQKQISADVDPFEYMASASSKEIAMPSITPPVISDISPHTPPPPLSRIPSSELKKKIASCDQELIAYAKMLNDIRALYKNEDLETNPGILLSPKVSLQPQGMEEEIVKLHVSMEGPSDPVILSCGTQSLVDVIVCQALVDFELLEEDSNKYILRLCSSEEFLSNQSRLGEYAYIQEKIRLFGRSRHHNNNNFIELILLPLSELHRSLRRLSIDDRKDTQIHPEDISSSDAICTLSYESIKILVETLKTESRALMKSSLSSEDDRPRMKPNSLNKVLQAVKAVCTLLGNLETIELYEACDRLTREVCAIEKSNHPYSADRIQSAMSNLQKNVFNLIDIYSKTFRVDFSLRENSCRLIPKKTTEMPETLLVRVCALHRLKMNWAHLKDFGVSISLYHGVNRMTNPVKITLKERSEGFYECVFFDSWLDLYEVCSLPRESRLVFSLVGTESGAPQDLGWASLQLFDHEGFLAQGSFRAGPLAGFRLSPNADHCPLLSIELPEISPAKYPSIQPKSISPDILKEMAESDMEYF
ncbi:Phosphatidylinositol4phosphate 3kinase C2 domaincontaining subunit beta-like, partial [Caligus rogercresseyi]